MEAIWKFRLTVTENQDIGMPTGAKILTVQVQVQDGIPCIWALVNPAEEVYQERHIKMFGTGHQKNISGTYIGTFQLHSGSLIFHVFE